MYLFRKNKEDIGFSFTPKTNQVEDDEYKYKILPTPFEVKDVYEHPNVDFKNVNSDYALFNIKNLYHILPRMGRITSHVFMAIAYNLGTNTNLVKFNMAHYARQIAKSKEVLQYGVGELINLNIIAPTANVFHYIVNHNICYKGDLNEFVKIYKELYKDKELVYNAKGKLRINCY